MNQAIGKVNKRSLSRLQAIEDTLAESQAATTVPKGTKGSSYTPCGATKGSSQTKVRREGDGM